MERIHLLRTIILHNVYRHLEGEAVLRQEAIIGELVEHVSIHHDALVASRACKAREIVA
jgi:hypothetical protein